MRIWQCLCAPLLLCARKYRTVCPEMKERDGANSVEVLSTSKLHSSMEHYSYVEGVYIFDKAKVKVIKDERQRQSAEEPIVPTVEKVNEARRRLKSM